MLDGAADQTLDGVLDGGPADEREEELEGWAEEAPADEEIDGAMEEGAAELGWLNSGAELHTSTEMEEDTTGGGAELGAALDDGTEDGTPDEDGAAEAGTEVGKELDDAEDGTELGADDTDELGADELLSSDSTEETLAGAELEVEAETEAEAEMEDGAALDGMLEEGTLEGALEGALDGAADTLAGAELRGTELTGAEELAAGGADETGGSSHPPTRLGTASGPLPMATRLVPHSAD